MVFHYLNLVTFYFFLVVYLNNFEENQSPQNYFFYIIASNNITKLIWHRDDYQFDCSFTWAVNNSLVRDLSSENSHRKREALTARARNNSRGKVRFQNKNKQSVGSELVLRICRTTGKRFVGIGYRFWWSVKVRSTVKCVFILTLWRECLV